MPGLPPRPLFCRPHRGEMPRLRRVGPSADHVPPRPHPLLSRGHRVAGLLPAMRRARLPGVREPRCLPDQPSYRLHGGSFRMEPRKSPGAERPGAVHPFRPRGDRAPCPRPGEGATSPRSRPPGPGRGRGLAEIGETIPPPDNPFLSSRHRKGAPRFGIREVLGNNNLFPDNAPIPVP